jgi:type IV secretory pathway VirJ component
LAGASPRERIGILRRLYFVLAAPLLLATAKPSAVEEHRQLPGFGDVAVYRPKNLGDARGVVLFVSGDGGWKLGVVDMARLLDDRAIVVGLSMPAWQKRVEAHSGQCWYPGGELEVAAQALEKLYALPHYVRPILVGYSSGATVVYGAVAQAPPTTFRGAVSLGFCPDLEVRRRFCGTSAWHPGWDEKKKQSWLPEAPAMSEREGGGVKWIALQGMIDQVCAPQQTVKFVERVPHAKVIPIEKVGHGFSVTSRWRAAFDRSINELLEPRSVLAPFPHTVSATPELAPPEEMTAKLEELELPLTITWPPHARAIDIFVSGDGGWADLDDGVAQRLASHGIAVVGWNALRYFWLEKPPRRFADDLARVVSALPPELSVFAGGYSFGAETVPVVVAGAEDPALRRIAGLILLSPSPYASFEVSPLDWIRTGTQPTTNPVGPAIERAGRPVLCISASDDTTSGCPAGTAADYAHERVPGGHHFGSDYDALASRIDAFVSAHKAP